MDYSQFPMGSSDPRAAKVNKENFDLFSVSMDLTYTDRFGVPRMTMHGMEQSVRGLVIATTEVPGVVVKATIAQAQSGTGTQVPDVSGVYSLISDLGLSRTDPKYLGGGSIADRKTAGIYMQNVAADGTVANGYPADGFYGLITVRRVSNFSAGDPRVIRYAFNFPTGKKYFQTSLAGGSFGAWKEDWTTNNTTIDANGFVKQASPIINLFKDGIEPNDSLEVANAEFERVDIGHYILRNVPLLSRDGWYIETPKDRNGNVYFTIDYDESVEGELTIRTYEPNYSTGRATNGNPVDILDGRFVSLRFEEIPELYPAPEELTEAEGGSDE